MNKYTKEEVMKAAVEYFNGDVLAANVWLSKYALRDFEGMYHELSPSDMHERLAVEFARVEAKYPNSMDKQEIYELFKDFKYIVPQGSPMSGIGNPYQVQSLSNCFVIPSPVDSYGGILHTDQQQIQIMKRRGGVGFDLSNLRPRGLTCENAARTTDGIEVFMERFSNSCREVAQGGRRGALMLSLSCHHPQIMDFVKLKRDLTKVTGANISVRVSDKFMKAVKSNSLYEQRWPVDSKEPEILNMTSAKEVWDEIIKSAHASAEPGILFWDTAIKNTPSDIYAEDGFGSTSTNPCVAGDTLVETNAGFKTVKELADNKANFFVKSFNTETLEVEMKPAIAFKTKDNAKVLKITTKSGKVIILTPDHRVFTDRGWVQAGELTSGHKILGLSK